MPEYICPRDGEIFSERPANGRCPTHKVLVDEIGGDSDGAKSSPAKTTATVVAKAKSARSKRS